jgi:hypothetical protein
MIELNKTYRTQSNFEVKLYAIYPDQEKDNVHGAYKMGNRWIACEWRLDGTRWGAGEPSILDLSECKNRYAGKLYAGVLRGDDGEFDLTEPFSRIELAQEICNNIYGDEVLAVIEIEFDFEEGEGL